MGEQRTTGRGRRRGLAGIALVALVLAGCSSSGGSDSATTDGPEPTTSDAAPITSDGGGEAVDLGDVEIIGLSSIGVPVCDLFTEDQSIELAPGSDGVDVSSDDYSCVRGSGDVGSALIDGGYAYYEDQGGTDEGFEYVDDVGADAYFSTPSTGEPAIYVRAVSSDGASAADFYLVTSEGSLDDEATRSALVSVAQEVTDSVVAQLDAA